MNGNLEKSDSHRLTLKQKELIKKIFVFSLMGIFCAGIIFWIFVPGDKANKDRQSGFNTDIPTPKDKSLPGDKREAYEKETVKQNQTDRMQSLQDFSALLDSAAPEKDGLSLMTDSVSIASSLPIVKDFEKSRTKASIEKSARAYQDVNRTLGNFYETPKNDPEKEELKRQVEELQVRMDETENRKKSVDEQMALMEKSFQMAAKYMPGTSGTTTAPTANASESAGVQKNGNTAKNVSGKAAVTPVSPVREQTVSLLQGEMSGTEFIETCSQPRNLGFFTATSELAKERKNTISACVHSDQTVMDGESVRLRLLEPMQAGKMLISENTILSGFSKIQGERLQITINSIEYNGSIIPVEMAVYDTDGQRGIFIPDTKEINAAKEVVANMGTSAGTSINLSNNAGEQFATDMGRNLIQGVSQFFTKKMQEVRVNLKAGYRVFLMNN